MTKTNAAHVEDFARSMRTLLAYDTVSVIDAQTAMHAYRDLLAAAPAEHREQIIELCDRIVDTTNGSTLSDAQRMDADLASLATLMVPNVNGNPVTETTAVCRWCGEHVVVRVHLSLIEVSSNIDDAVTSHMHPVALDDLHTCANIP